MILEKKDSKTIKIESSKNRNNCVNHEDKRATRTCDECDQPYCNDCMNEFWTHNFLSYAYLGEKKEFNKHWLCKDCVKKKRKKGVLTAVFVLVAVFIIPVFVLISNY